MSTNTTSTGYTLSCLMHINGGQVSGMGATEQLTVTLLDGQLTVTSGWMLMPSARATVELDVPAPLVWSAEHEALIVALTAAGWALSVPSLEGRAAPVEVDVDVDDVTPAAR